MSITDELQRLHDLREQGALSQDEFARAKAALLGGQTAPHAVAAAKEQRSGSPDSRPHAIAVAKFIVVAGALIAGAVWLLEGLSGTRSLVAATALAIVHSPIDLRDSIENVRAASWQGIPIEVPYSGTLHVEFTVLDGNPQRVHLMDTSQIEAYRARETYQHYAPFEAQESRTYRRASHILQGSYYLVVEDPSFGILSASASDVKIHVRLEP